MKMIKVVPLVLAGLCGYLHTTINKRFHSLADQSMLSMIDMPHSDRTKSGRDAASSQSTVSSSTSTSISTPRRKRPRRELDINLLQGPATDAYDTSSERRPVVWSSIPIDERITTHNDEYQAELLQYAIDLLPKYRDNPDNGHGPIQAEPDMNPQPKAYDFSQIDILVPASGQDDRLFLFARRLGVTLTHFRDWYNKERRPTILRQQKQQEEEVSAKITDNDGQEEEGKSKPSRDMDSMIASGSQEDGRDLGLRFRFLITRYPADAQKSEADLAALHGELSKLTTLAQDDIEIISAGQREEEEPNDEQENSNLQHQFNRAKARNILHKHACHLDACLVTVMDVDMHVLPIYFHRALTVVKPYRQAYFPIVFSEFNPETVQRVQDFLNSNNKQRRRSTNGHRSITLLPPFSEHRGLWRDFGYGMYALAGCDAARFRFNEQYEGWGHEDNDFYESIHSDSQMQVQREREYGLIHEWHSKNCSVGKDITTKEQWVDCHNSRNIMEGDALGLLLRAPLVPVNPEDFSRQVDTDNKKEDDNDGNYLPAEVEEGEPIPGHKKAQEEE